MRPRWLLIPFLCFFIIGCVKPQPPVTTLTTAQEYFLKICRDELKIDAKVIPIGKSVWVYIPMSSGFFNLKAAAKTPKVEPVKSWSLAFVEATFKEKTFSVSYDIELTKKYDPGMSFQNKYSDEYSKKQREVITALTRAYFDVKQSEITVPLRVGDSDPQPLPEAVGNGLPPEGAYSAALEHLDGPGKPFPTSDDAAPPEFFVMVFADITNGVAMKSISYFPDMKMAMSNPPALTNEEYGKRFVYELFGDEDIIGDQTGEHLKVEKISLPYFLAKQIENRIKFKFTQSAFPPTGEAQNEIWNIVAETCRLYDFHDFEKIKLIDLKNEKESTYDKSQM